VTITRNGLPAAVILSSDEYESIMETLALAGDPADRDRITEAEQTLADGEVTTGEEMRGIIAERVGRDTGAA